MPRHARLDAPSALHHIMVRGINKAAIFIDDTDRITFLNGLGSVVEDGKCTVYAFALIDNQSGNRL